MKFFRWDALRLCVLFSWPTFATAATIFQDGFETGFPGPAWIVSGLNDGRVSASTNYAPATGQWLVVLDDSVSDAVYSAAEATLQLDLSNKKNVALSFKVKSLGNEPDYPWSWLPVGPRGFHQRRRWGELADRGIAGDGWDGVGNDCNSPQLHNAGPRRSVRRRFPDPIFRI